MTDSESEFFITVPPNMTGVRLDKALSELMPAHSRATLQQWLKDGHILVDGLVCKQKQKIIGGEILRVCIPQAEPADWEAQDLSLDVVYQDNEIIVVNKPQGLVVHPGAGNPDGTLLNGLLHLDPGLRILPGAGIVHRIDKDTSGLLVVAKTEHARQHLIEQLQDHSMSRQYIAVVNGVMVSGETIDQPIGRHRHDRLKMAVTHSGKPAVTHIRVVKKFRGHCVIQAELETGRTHQIRVHMGWRGYPLIGDITYGGRVKLPENPTDELVPCLRNFKRQALHAKQLSLVHPGSNERLSWKQPLPEDMLDLMRCLANDSNTHSPADPNGWVELG